VGNEDAWYTENDGDGGWGRFFLKLAAVLLVGGAVVVIVLFIWSRASVAFGFLGGFLLIALILIVLGKLYDRRHARREPE
jgi:predicted permease